MSCAGCIKVVVKILDRKGITVDSFLGLMANGGCISLEKPIQREYGDTIRIQNIQSKEAWDVKSLGFIGRTKGDNKRYKYHVYLIPVRIT